METRNKLHNGWDAIRMWTNALDGMPKGEDFTLNEIADLENGITWIEAAIAAIKRVINEKLAKGQKK